MRHLIWDLDGTLVDSSADIEQSLELAIGLAGIDIRKKTRAFIIGPPLETIIREAFQMEALASYAIENAVRAFRNIYDNSNFSNTIPFPGVESLIMDSENFVHHLVTNKPDYPSKRILEKLSWTNYIASVNTPSTILGRQRSKIEIFNELIEELCVEKSSIVGIGDTKNDCLAARENGIVSIGVLWGSGTLVDMEQSCDYLVENCDQLCKLLYETSK